MRGIEIRLLVTSSWLLVATIAPRSSEVKRRIEGRRGYGIPLLKVCSTKKLQN